MQYVTTRCNRPHRMRDGKPMRHECEVIPPAALQAERDGDMARAADIIEAAKRPGAFGERTLPVMRRGVRRGGTKR